VVLADRITTVILGAFILVYLIVAGGYPGESKVVPLIFGGAGLAMVGIQLLAPYVPYLRTFVGEVDSEEGSRILSESRLRRRLFAVSLSLILVPVSIALIGLVLTLPLYAALFTLFDRQRPVFVLLTTVAAAAVSYGLLVALISTPWNGGLLLGGL